MDYYKIISVIIIIIILIILVFRYEIGISKFPTCDPEKTCALEKTVNDCKFISTIAHDWPTINKADIIGGWENTEIKNIIFNLYFNEDGRIIQKMVCNNIFSDIVIGYYPLTSYGIFYFAQAYCSNTHLEYNPGNGIPEVKKIIYDNNTKTLNLITIKNNLATLQVMQQPSGMEPILNKKYGFENFWKGDITSFAIYTDKIIVGYMKDNKFIKTRASTISYPDENENIYDEIKYTVDNQNTVIFLHLETKIGGFTPTKKLAYYPKTNTLDIITGIYTKI